MDPEHRKLVAKSCPHTAQALFGRKFLLSQSRQPDYANRNFTDVYDLECLLRYAAHEPDIGNQKTNFLTLAATLSCLEFGRPTLFLEPELGAAFLRSSKILTDFQISDVRWRWGAYRIVTSLQLLRVKLASFAYFTICHVEPSDRIRCPLPIAREVDSHASKFWPGANHRLERLECRFKQSGYIISAGLNPAQISSDQPYQTVYSIFRPWDDLCSADHEASGAASNLLNPSDDPERETLRQLEYVALNTLLFLSAAPLEYEADEIIRKGRREGTHQVAELIRARFVGQSQLRAIRHRPASKPSVDAAASETTSTGTPHRPHWAAGCWRKVCYGPRNSLRKLAWIQPYRTGGEDEYE